MDIAQTLLIKQSGFKVSISVESYDKNDWKLPKLLHMETHSFHTILAQIGVLSKDCIKISRPYLINFPKNKSSKNVTVGSGQFIVLKDSASPKMVIHIYLYFSDFCKKETKKRKKPFKSPIKKGNLNMTANRNFDSFTHS